MNKWEMYRHPKTGTIEDSNFHPWVQKEHPTDNLSICLVVGFLILALIWFRPCRKPQ